MDVPRRPHLTQEDRTLIANTPITVNRLTIPNRILRSATMENMADARGTATDALVRLYRTVAKGGAGLIVVGASAVDPPGRVWQHQLALWSDGGVAALSRIPAAIHESGAGKCAIQLHHGGTAGFGYSYGEAVGCIDVNSATDHEIESIIAAFGRAAARAARAGFDAVAVHGAHGYLISQFLSPAINLRGDAWGGSPEGRLRFPLAVCRAIRSEIDTGMPLLWKMNCSDYLDDGNDIDTYAQAAGALVEEGVDLIEVSGGVKEQIKLRNALKKTAGERESYFTHAIQPFRQAIGKTALAVTGGLRSLKAIEKTLAEGADMVGVCRPIISQPKFPSIIFQGGDHPKARCISCNKCLLHIAEHPLKCVHFDL